jgi:glutathione S-transferase
LITLHHLEYSQSFRILWLLEELGVEYTLKEYERDKAMKLAPAEYKEISPTGAAPVISDGEVVLAESSAIIDYILDKHPSETLRPSVDSPRRAGFPDASAARGHHFSHYGAACAVLHSAGTGRGFWQSQVRIHESKN